jgi:ABC-type amino acid transport substrate-binding protein
MIKRATAAAVLMTALAALASAQAKPKVFAGEQPGLFSSSGGIVDKVVVAALKAVGREVDFEWVPIGRMLTLLKQDSLDYYLSASNTPAQHNPHVDFLEARGVFFYKKARFPDLKAKSLEDLAGLCVATVLNSPNTPLFTEAGMIVDEGPYETWFNKLDLNRVDLVATADVGGILSIRRLFPGRESEFAFTEVAYSTIRAGLYAKNDPALLADVAAGFAKIRTDGSLESMLKEYFGASWHRVRVVH